MADVFIAYSQRDRDAALELARHIEEYGYTTWWDTDLIAGDSFSEVIQRNIAEARVAIVIWTESSVESRWVRAEAGFAARHGKLVPIILGDLDPAALPIEFKLYHTEKLSAINAASLRRIRTTIERLAGQASSTAADTGPPKPEVSLKAEAVEQPWVFISHVDEDKARIRPYVERLLENGLCVFVDKPAKLGLPKKWVGSPSLNYIRYFDNYRRAISKALDKSGCVLVFWSAGSVQTDRQIFWDEIEFGSANGFLVSTMIDDVISGSNKIPKGYGFSQANIADLTSDDAIDAEFHWVIADVKKLISEYGSKLSLPPVPANST